MAVEERAVRAALDRVMDPELDEPVTEMGFVEGVEIEGGAVTVAFRLPTYWCSPNFAFLMVEGIRREVGAVAGVARVEVDLRDHLYAEELKGGAAEGRAFLETFAGAMGGDGLEEVRRAFADKAFQRRQEAVLRDLREQGMADAEIVGVTLAGFDRLAFRGGEVRRRAPLYRALLVERFAPAPEDAAFVGLDGAPIPPEALDAHLAGLRRVRINMEFGGALCRGLKASRYKQAARRDGELTLVDFLPDAPPRAAV